MTCIIRSAILAAVAMVAAVAAYESKDPAASGFAHKFADIVLFDKTDSGVFDVASIPGKEAGPIFRKVLERFLKERGTSAEAATVRGKRLEKAVSKGLDRVSPADFAVLVGYNLASALKTTDKLNRKSFNYMATEAALDFDSLAQEGQLSSTENKLQTLLEGYEKFLNRYGLNKESMEDVFIANAVKILS